MIQNSDKPEWVNQFVYDDSRYMKEMKTREMEGGNVKNMMGGVDGVLKRKVATNLRKKYEFLK